MDDLIREFLAARTFCLVGASSDPSKYGNVILKRMVALGFEPIPINPKADTIEGLRCYARLADVPGGAPMCDLVVPPQVGLSMVTQLVEAGCRIAWLQPGAESDELVSALEGSGVRVIHGSPCIMVSAVTVRG